MSSLLFTLSTRILAGAGSVLIAAYEIRNCWKMLQEKNPIKPKAIKSCMRMESVMIFIWQSVAVGAILLGVVSGHPFVEVMGVMAYACPFLLVRILYHSLALSKLKKELPEAEVREVMDA